MAEKPAEQQDPQKAYLSEQLNKVSGEIGEGYGEPLMDELMSRLEKTVADFHEEVTEMLVDLKKKSQERQEKLKDRWANKDDVKTEGGEEESAAAAEPQADASDWEKRIEEKEAKAGGGRKERKAEEEDKPKKKGFFKRKKKKKKD
jgi:hypothetical protein